MTNQSYKDNAKNYDTKNTTLVFINKDCIDCKRVKPQINFYRYILLKKITIVDVNNTSNMNLKKKFKVKYTPTFIKVRNNREVNKYIGTNSKKFTKLINE